jgi:hypothetical protein
MGMSTYCRAGHRNCMASFYTRPFLGTALGKDMPHESKRFLQGREITIPTVHIEIDMPLMVNPADIAEIATHVGSSRISDPFPPKRYPHGLVSSTTTLCPGYT